MAGDVEAVRSLIAGGADLDEQGDLGTPLHVAALKDDAAIAAILLDAGADKEAAIERTGMRPLHVAASYDRPSVAALLLDRGAMVDAKEASGQTPLLLVSKTGGADVARLLLDHGADVDARRRSSGVSLALRRSPGRHGHGGAAARSPREDRPSAGRPQDSECPPTAPAPPPTAATWPAPAASGAPPG